MCIHACSKESLKDNLAEALAQFFKTFWRENRLMMRLETVVPANEQVRCADS